jgi:DNA-binding response OmpR family regulator
MTDREPAEPSQPQILICEDDPVQGRLLEELLEARGYRCIGPFARPSEAEEAARTAPIRAALLDVALEGGSTKGTAAELKKRGIPFAFITAYDPGTAPTIATYSTELVVPKPVSPDLLLHIMEALIPSATAE